MRVDERRLRVSVRHSEPVVDAGLSAALGIAPGFDLVSGSDSTVARADVVVCDLDASLAFDFEGTGCPAVVLLIRNPRPCDIQQALDRGVLGVLATRCSLEELCSAVRAAGRGERFLCRTAARQLANGLHDEALTGRERDVLPLLAEGRCNKTIATLLDIGVGTVKTHVRSIMAKLDATSRTHAASVAFARGMLPDDRFAEAHAAPGGRAASVSPFVAQALAARPIAHRRI